MIAFNANLLPFVAHAAALRDVRKYLNGVHVTPCDDGVIVVATDGHRMAIAHDPAGECDSPVTFTPDKGLIAAAKKKGAARVMVDRAAGRAEVQDHHARSVFIQPTVTFNDDRYPDWRRVLPRDVQEGSGGAYLNPRYLSEAVDAFAGMGITKYPAVTMFTGKEPGTPVILGAAWTTARCVIMPMRESGAVCWPAWL